MYPKSAKNAKHETDCFEPKLACVRAEAVLADADELLEVLEDVALVKRVD